MSTPTIQTSDNTVTLTAHHSSSGMNSVGGSGSTASPASAQRGMTGNGNGNYSPLLTPTSPPALVPAPLMHGTSLLTNTSTGSRGNMSSRGRTSHVQVQPSSSSGASSPLAASSHHFQMTRDHPTLSSPTAMGPSPVPPSPMGASSPTLSVVTTTSNHPNATTKGGPSSAAVAVAAATAAANAIGNGKDGKKDIPTIIPSAPPMSGTTTATIAEKSAKAAAVTANGGLCCGTTKCPSQRSCKTWWRYFLPSFVGVLVIAVVVYLWRADIEDKRTLTNQESLISNTATLTLGKLLFLAGDHRVLGDALRMACLVARPNAVPAIPCALGVLGSSIPPFLVHRGYNSIRVINSTGQEVVSGRYNRITKTATMIPEAQLSNLQNLPAWKALASKQVGEAAITSIGTIRTSPTAILPTFLVSVNAPNSWGEISASIMIDYNIDTLLAFIQSQGAMLVNSAGYFIVGAPDGVSNLGFAYGATDPRFSYKFGSLWPGAWEIMTGQMQANTNRSYNFTNARDNVMFNDVTSMGQIYSFKTDDGSFVFSDVCWSFLIGARVPQTGFCPPFESIRYFMVSFEPSSALNANAVQFSGLVWIAGAIVMLGWGFIATRLTRTSTLRALAEEEAAYNRKLADQALSTQRLVVGPMAKLSAHLDMARHKKQTAPKVTTIIAATNALAAPPTPTRGSMIAAAVAAAAGHSRSGKGDDSKVAANEATPAAVVGPTSRVLTVADIPALSSLDMLLEDEFCSRYFNSFLLREWTSENLLFYNDVRAFRSTMTEAAELIFNLYIADHADFQVNIPSRGAASIAASMGQAPRADMFDDAQGEVKRLLVLNSFPRFFESDICIDMMAEINRKAQHGRNYDSSEGSKRSSGRGSNVGNAITSGKQQTENNGMYGEVSSRHSVAATMSVVVSGTGNNGNGNMNTGPNTPVTQSRVGVGITSQAHAAQRLSHQKAVASAFTSSVPESPTGARASIADISNGLYSHVPSSPHSPPPGSPILNHHSRQRSSPVPPETINARLSSHHHHHTFGPTTARAPLHTSTPHGSAPNSTLTPEPVAPSIASSAAVITAGTTKSATKGLASSHSSSNSMSTITAPGTIPSADKAGGTSAVVITVDRRSPSPHSRRHLMYAVQQRKKEQGSVGGVGISSHTSFDAPDAQTSGNDTKGPTHLTANAAGMPPLPGAANEASFSTSHVHTRRQSPLPGATAAFTTIPEESH